MCASRYLPAYLSVRHCESTFNSIGLWMDVAHRHHDTAVSCNAGKRMGVGSLLGKVREGGVTENVRFETLNAGVLQ